MGKNPMDWPTCPFWDYSTALYSRPGIEAACLDLQRRHGLDVNLVLFACWLASRGIELDQAALARAGKAISDWQAEVTRPLRALRRRLGVRLDHAEPESLLGRWFDQTSTLRRAVLALELDSEHLAQLALDDIGADLPVSRLAGADLAAVNLLRYWPFQTDDLDQLQVIVRQAFPETTPAQLENAFSALLV